MMGTKICVPFVHGYWQQKGIGRVFFEESLFVANYTAERDGATIAFKSTVSYEVEMVKGLGNIFLGGEGLFLTKR